MNRGLNRFRREHKIFKHHVTSLVIPKGPLHIEVEILRLTGEMTDPVSIIGTVGALANIIQLVSQTISGIRDLQSDWKDANLNFLSLLGQLSTLRVALIKIDTWMKNGFGDAHHQLVLDLDATMHCCGILLTNLQESVEKLQQRQDHTLDFQSKIRLMFDKKGRGDIQRLLEHQTNALTLVLAACNWYV